MTGGTHKAGRILEMALYMEIALTVLLAWILIFREADLSRKMADALGLEATDIEMEESGGEAGEKEGGPEPVVGMTDDIYDSLLTGRYTSGGRVFNFAADGTYEGYVARGKEYARGTYEVRKEKGKEKRLYVTTDQGDASFGIRFSDDNSSVVLTAEDGEEIRLEW